MVVSRIDDFRKVAEGVDYDCINVGKKFYEELYYRIENLKNTIISSGTYKNYLLFENELSKLDAEVQNMDNIQVKTNENIYDGIKYILRLKVLRVREMLKKKKLYVHYAVEEEKYKGSDVFKEEYSNVKNEDLVQMECENKHIVGGKEYEITRSRLRDISKIQQQIKEQLDIQNERIDDICETSRNTKSVYKDINKIQFNTDGNWFKQVVYKIIVGSIIFLIILHCANR